ncbi:hypothetical protein F5Y08DRAFT_291245, partial [Xylaria arbuscula]
MTNLVHRWRVIGSIGFVCVCRTFAVKFTNGRAEDANWGGGMPPTIAVLRARGGGTGYLGVKENIIASMRKA